MKVDSCLVSSNAASGDPGIQKLFSWPKRDSHYEGFHGNSEQRIQEKKLTQWYVEL